MSDFPPIAPNQIGYDLGRLNLSEVKTNGGPIRFRHSSQVTANSFRLRFTGLDQTQIETLRQHYIDNGGTHNYFEVPAVVWGNYSAVSSTSVYRYAEPPSESHMGLYYDLDVVLRITTGTNLLYILQGGTATNRTPLDYIAFESLVFNGTAPFTLNAGAANPNTPAATLLLKGGGAST